MTLEEIQAELDRLLPMVTAKGVKLSGRFSYNLNAAAAPDIDLWYRDANDCFATKLFRSFADLAAWIDALPTPETKALRDHNDRLANVIDQARDAGVPDEYVTPLVVVREALSSNLLAAPQAAEHAGVEL